MKTTFIQSLRYMLLEIFHPRDFRKVAGDKCLRNDYSSTDNSSIDTGCTDTGRTDTAYVSDSPHRADGKPESEVEQKSRNECIVSSVSSQSSKPIVEVENNAQAVTSAPQEVESKLLFKDFSELNAYYLKQEKNLFIKNVLIKVLIFCLLAFVTLLIAPKSKANDRQSMASVSAGLLCQCGLELTAQFERSTSYHNAWAVELNGYQQWIKCPTCKLVCKKSFWKYYRSYHLGLVFKPCVYRSRNQHGRLRLGASIGSDTKRVLAGVLLGYEQTYCLQHGWEFFWTVKTDMQVMAKTWVRPGVSIGVRLPL